MSELTPKQTKVSVLVVEDEPSIRAALCLLLEFQGYRCTPATDGRDAIAKIDGAPPAVVVTDYMMPHMDGLSLAKAIRDDPRCAGVPIILITGIPPPNVMTADLVDVVMQKPVGGGVLMQAIQQVLSQRDPGRQRETLARH
jgi:CheY-like chemotaxis protein